MKTNWLIATAAVAILASTGLASAQGMNERGGTSPGAVQKNAPSSQSQIQEAEPRKGDRAQSPRNGAQQRRQTTGQSPQADRPSRPSGQQQGDRLQRQKQPPGAAQQGQDMKRDKSGTAGQAPDSQRQQRIGTDQQKQKQRTGAEQRKDSQTRSETTGRGDTSGASLNSEQRTKIRQVVVSKKIPKVNKVNFTVSIGAKVPRTVRFHPIPVEIVEIYPAWRGYRVILVGSELVIVHPSTFEIVAVIVV